MSETKKKQKPCEGIPCDHLCIHLCDIGNDQAFCTLYKCRLIEHEKWWQRVGNCIGNFHNAVDHPKHYAATRYETITILQDKLTPEQFEGFCIGNAIKYLTRYRNKNVPIEDLKKAQWYLDHIICLMDHKKDFWGPDEDEY